VSRQCLTARAPSDERSARPPGSGQCNPKQEVSPTSLFAGLDWGSTGHAVCVIDEHGTAVLRLDVRHDADGLAALVAQLERLGPPDALSVAIERPSGLVVDTLLAAGHPVVPIHPNVVKACRPRYRAAGAKSDPGDAYLLADILRTDGHRFAPLDPVSDAIRALRVMVRSRDDLVATRVGVTNRLRSLLEGFWPGAAVIFTELDSGSRSPSSPASRPRRAPDASAAPASPPASPGTVTRDGAPPTRSSPGCAPPHAATNL
jgi:hypothetical protein